MGRYEPDRRGGRAFVVVGEPAALHVHEHARRFHRGKLERSRDGQTGLLLGARGAR